MLVGLVAVVAHDLKSLGWQWTASALVTGLAAALLVTTAPPLWNRLILAERKYPSALGTFYASTRRQLEILGLTNACVLNQYGAAYLPPGYRQLGVTFPPWSSRIASLNSTEAWVRWLRENGVSWVVGQQGQRLGGLWQVTPLMHDVDFGSLSEWMDTCAGVRHEAHWIACPVP